MTDLRIGDLVVCIVNEEPDIDNVSTIAVIMEFDDSIRARKLIKMITADRITSFGNYSSHVFWFKPEEVTLIQHSKGD